LPEGDTPVLEIDGNVLVARADHPAPRQGAVERDDGGAEPGHRTGRGGERVSLRTHVVISDTIAVTIAWMPVALIGSGTDRGRQLVAAVAAIAATLLALRQAGLYRPHLCALPTREAARVLGSTVFGALVFALCEWMAGSVNGTKALAGAAISAALVLALRWRFGRWLKGQRSCGRHLRAALLVGTNDDAVGLWNMLNDEPELGYRIVGVVGEERSDAPWKGQPNCIEISDLPDLATRTGAKEVIAVAGALPADVTAAAVGDALAAGLHVQVWPGFTGLSTKRVRIAPVSGIPVFYVEPPGAPTWQKVAKRAIDVLLTLAIAPLVLPILLVAAIRIKLEDGGPVLYHHSALGRYGAPITVLKLRTMVPNASQMLAEVAALNERTGGPLFKATNDPRVTRIGRFLRASSIDELPQLWNVLTGTMSLVGPRFSSPHEDTSFDADLRRRYQMRPGITGLWQSEARDNPAFSAYRRLDLFYVDNWSLGLDLTILANTAHAVSVRALKTILPTRDHSGAGSGDLTVASLAAPELAAVEPVSSE
jgi:exopolysaccharide biosynthesis polyprenyl glycosylphosphotransferase